jgi:hypothetical protein
MPTSAQGKLVGSGRLLAYMHAYICPRKASGVLGGRDSGLPWLGVLGLGRASGEVFRQSLERM